MLQQIASFVINIFKFHKKKLLVVILSAMICFLWLFPYEDLSDLVTERVAKETQNKVFITFDDLNLALFPAPGLDMTSVKLEIQNIAPIEVKALSLSPSIASLLAFKLGFVAKLEGLLDGDVQLTVKPGDKTSEKEKDIKFQNIDFEAENIQLDQIKKFAKMPIELKGRANFEFNAEVDPQFIEQPEAEASLTTKKLKLPSSTIPSQMGPMPFPEMNFSKVNFKGRLIGGDLVIEQLELGTPQDPLFLRAKGTIGLEIRNTGAGLAPRPGSFDLKLEINNKDRNNKDLQLPLSFLDSYKSGSGDKDTYLLRVKAAQFGVNPNMSKLNKFD